jgi:hypothetical protein
MNLVIHHLDKSYQPLKLARDFHDNQSRQGCVAVHEDSLHRPPNIHLAFRMGTTYNSEKPSGQFLGLIVMSH